jgi:two-component system chemotaxis response regulator CheY
MGFSNVYTAQTGKEALHVVDQHNIDLIVADWHMPEMSGVEMIRSLRSGDVAGKVPVILVTAEDRASMVREAFEARADGYIVKPFSFAKLLETATAVLERYDADGRYQGSTEQAKAGL